MYTELNDKYIVKNDKANVQGSNPT